MTHPLRQLMRHAWGHSYTRVRYCEHVCSHLSHSAWHAREHTSAAHALPSAPQPLPSTQHSPPMSGYMPHSSLCSVDVCAGPLQGSKDTPVPLRSRPSAITHPTAAHRASTSSPGQNPAPSTQLSPRPPPRPPLPPALPPAPPPMPRMPVHRRGT
jgi:hypothetical protein